MDCLDLDDTEAELAQDEYDCFEAKVELLGMERVRPDLKHTPVVKVQRKKRTAKKTYHCFKCGCEIQAGQKYIDFATYGTRTRCCLKCNKGL